MNLHISNSLMTTEPYLGNVFHIYWTCPVPTSKECELQVQNRVWVSTVWSPLCGSLLNHAAAAKSHLLIKSCWRHFDLQLSCLHSSHMLKSPQRLLVLHSHSRPALTPFTAAVSVKMCHSYCKRFSWWYQPHKVQIQLWGFEKQQGESELWLVLEPRFSPINQSKTADVSSLDFWV